MSIPTVSTTQLPEDIWGKIATHCDVRTLYAFRGSCRAANAAGKDYMSEEVAARVIFHNPERYRTLRWNALKESRKVVINALTKMPELFLEPSFPEQFRQDGYLAKTALLAASMLDKPKVADEIKQRTHLSLNWNDRVDLARFQPVWLYIANFFKNSSEKGNCWFTFDIFYVWQSLGQLLESNTVPEEIRENIDVVLELLKTYDISRIIDVYAPWLDDKEFARQAVHIKPSVYPRLSLRLRDSEEIAKAAIEEDFCNFSSVSPRLQNDIPFIRSLIQSTGSRCSQIILQQAGDDVRSDFWCARKAVFKNVFNLPYVKGAPRLVLWPLCAPLYILATAVYGVACIGLGLLAASVSLTEWINRRIIRH